MIPLFYVPGNALDSDAKAFAARSGASDVKAWSDWFKSAKSIGLTQSMISLWAFGTGKNAGTGTTAYDAISTNDLTLTNGPTWAADSMGFVGASSQYLTVNSNASLVMGDIDFTISMWVNDPAVAVSTYEYYISKGNPSSAGGEFGLLGGLGTGSGPTGWRVRDAANSAQNAAPTSATCSVQMTSGAWSHLVFWHDSTANTLNIQLNGGTVSSQAWTGGVFAGTNTLRIGAGSGGNYCTANIDEVGIWKRVLSADDRAWLYNSGNGRI